MKRIRVVVFYPQPPAVSINGKKTGKDADSDMATLRPEAIRSTVAEPQIQLVVFRFSIHLTSLETTHNPPERSLSTRFT